MTTTRNLIRGHGRPEGSANGTNSGGDDAQQAWAPGSPDGRGARTARRLSTDEQRRQLGRTESRARRTGSAYRCAPALSWVRRERGDVPGWVLITIMSAGIVAVLWPFAEQYLRDMLEAALDLVQP